ncbi:hypothetical protein B0T10DRAFT_321357 [Thelonectria olida]|uniref:Uncharacterized protein n=1 Tax=Thelonectria olida TaxID=1576542 RepID=A0A9P8W559_9HYPO|nr:hypothetical protein B0T10DRAFT_321357 [Thelonectria olida]
MGSSFTDEEKRFLLAEIIKTSQMDVDTLSNFIRANGIEPNWLQMQLPFGRNMNQCMQAADQVGIKQVSWLKRKMTDDHGGPSSKRMSLQGNVEPSSVAPGPHHVPILPRPASSSAEITPAPTPAPPPAPPATGPKKKGRPSRADRAKLRPILPQAIAPRPPVEQNENNQPANQSNAQPANQSSNQSNTQLATQPATQPTNQSNNQLAQFQTNQTAAVPRTIPPRVMTPRDSCL